MRRFALAFVTCAVAIAVVTPVASAIPQATLSCRKTGGDSRTYVQLPTDTALTYKLKDVIISS